MDVSVYALVYVFSLPNLKLQISVLDHNITARAPEILYYAIFGPEPPFHPEWKAFMQGFALKCCNGFTFLDVSFFFPPVKAQF